MAKEKNLTEETTEVVTDNTDPEVTPEQEGTTDPEGTEAPEDVAGDEVEEETEEDGSKVLVAVYPILFLSHQYKVGELLPTNYPDMVEAWLAAGTAVWADSEAPKAVKASPKTAEPGLPGVAVASESEDNLVGKVPKTAARKKK